MQTAPYYTKLSSEGLRRIWVGALKWAALGQLLQCDIRWKIVSQSPAFCCSSQQLPCWPAREGGGIYFLFFFPFCVVTVRLRRQNCDQYGRKVTPTQSFSSCLSQNIVTQGSYCGCYRYPTHCHQIIYSAWDCIGKGILKTHQGKRQIITFSIS